MKYIDLFSGAGGLSLGIKNSGGDLLFSNEIDSHSVETQKLNLKKLNIDPEKVISSSIEDLHKLIIGKEVKFEFQGGIIHENKSSKSYYKNKGVLNEEVLDKLKDIKNVDLIVGGPPCQGFSNAGRGKKSIATKNFTDYIDDPRNQLFKYFLDFVEYYTPKIVLIENVKGLATSMNYRKLIQTSLENTGPGYKTISLILKSSHFGVPQNRERIFFIGIREDVVDSEKLIFYLPTIIASKYKKEVCLKDAIDDLPKIVSNPKPLNTDIKNEIPIGQKNSFGEDISMVDYKKLIRKKTNYASLINIYRENEIEPKKLYNHKARFNNENDLKIYSLLSPGKYITNEENYAARQLVTYSTEKINGEMVFTSKFVDKYFKLDPDKPSKTITAHLKVDNNSFVHYGDIPRGITPREAARIQSFPDWYQFSGPFTSQFKQIGNAVPPLMAKALGEIFYDFINHGVDHLIDNQKN